MEKNKRQSTWRIVFSAIALTAFVLYALYDIHTLGNDSYNIYSWRLNVLNYLFLAVPYATLLLFSVMDCKLKHINSRIYAVGLFVIYLIQAIIMFISAGAANFSVLCCTARGDVSTVLIAFLCARLIMLFFAVSVHRAFLKLYSAGVIAVLSTYLIFSLDSSYYMMRFGIKGILGFVVDILLYVALYFFSNLMTDENEFNLIPDCIDGLLNRIFDFDSEDDDLIYEEPEKSFGTDYAAEYKALFIDAVNKEDEEFLKANEFLRSLSSERVTDNDNNMYSKEDYCRCLAIVADRIEKANSEKPGLVSEESAGLINNLIANTDGDNFRINVITAAKKLLGKQTEKWIDATEKYAGYDIDMSYPAGKGKIQTKVW